MKHEMENKLAIVMSNKGLYPKYIKMTHNSKAKKHARNLTEKWGQFLICLRPYKYLRNEEKQNTCETRKDIHFLNQGS